MALLNRDAIEVIEAKRGGFLDVTVTMSKEDGDLQEVEYNDVHKVVVDHLIGSLRIYGVASQYGVPEDYQVLHSNYASVSIAGSVMKRRKVNQPTVSKYPGDSPIALDT